MRMAYGYTMRNYGIAPWGIVRVTAGRWNHVVVIFYNEIPSLGDYFESTNLKDDLLGKSGLRGPYPVADLLQWAEDSPRHHFEIQPLPMVTEHEVEKARKMLEDHVETVRYARLQIARNWLLGRTGLVVGSVRSARAHRWTCSETAARCLPARLAVPYLSLGEMTYDQVYPSCGHNRGVGLYEEMEHAIKEHHQRAIWRHGGPA